MGVVPAQDRKTGPGTRGPRNTAPPGPAPARQLSLPPTSAYHFG